MLKYKICKLIYIKYTVLTIIYAAILDNRKAKKLYLLLISKVSLRMIILINIRVFIL